MPAKKDIVFADRGQVQQVSELPEAVYAQRVPLLKILEPFRGLFSVFMCCFLRGGVIA